MTTRTTTILVPLMTLGAIVAGALLWNQLPEQMASHWNVNDEVDGYMSKPWGVFMMPLVTLGMFALFLVVPAIDPLKANIAKLREAFNLFIVLIVAFMLYIHALTLAWSLGYDNFKMSTSMLPAMGLLFIFVGLVPETEAPAPRAAGSMAVAPERQASPRRMPSPMADGAPAASIERSQPRGQRAEPLARRPSVAAEPASRLAAFVVDTVFVLSGQAVLLAPVA